MLLAGLPVGDGTPAVFDPDFLENIFEDSNCEASWLGAKTRMPLSRIKSARGLATTSSGPINTYSISLVIQNCIIES